jgi:hypothetical protein
MHHQPSYNKIKSPAKQNNDRIFLITVPDEMVLCSTQKKTKNKNKNDITIVTLKTKPLRRKATLQKSAKKLSRQP